MCLKFIDYTYHDIYHPHQLLNVGDSFPLIELRKLRFTAAAAKSFQSCPTLRNPVDGSPPDSAIPGILQARVLEWGAIAFSVKVHTYNQTVKIPHN